MQGGRYFQMEVQIKCYGNSKQGGIPLPPQLGIHNSVGLEIKKFPYYKTFTFHCNYLFYVMYLLCRAVKSCEAPCLVSSVHEYIFKTNTVGVGGM